MFDPTFLICLLGIPSLVITVLIWQRRQEKLRLSALEGMTQHEVEMTLGLDRVLARATKAGAVWQSEKRQGLHIRPLQEKDIVPLQDLYDRLEARRLVPPGYSEHFTTSLLGRGRHFFVAELNGKLAGGAGIAEIGGVKEMPLPYGGMAPVFTLIFASVEPSLQGRGIGSLLLMARIASLAGLCRPVALMAELIPAGQKLLAPLTTELGEAYELSPKTQEQQEQQEQLARRAVFWLMPANTLKAATLAKEAGWEIPQLATPNCQR